MAANGLPWLRGAASAAVVNVTSVHANATSPKMSAYAASKGGLEALTRSLAIEWGSERIRVNAVAPAAIDTSMLRDGLNRGHLPSGTENALRELGARHPLGRIGLPEEVASAVYFLADARTSAFTTGTVLSVDGGAMSKLSTE
jgi:NAD(P)-dependent dehydrogenase (short-subunit alcohol dehydrogenase family)